mmetsp:Transcript_18020/g.2940  ORF Transcript_18020/g.2940 Transcript_18020/m.2940 type:complete len:119 (+) Transcript_18020:178-534(+)
MNFRLILENINRYGFMLKLPSIIGLIIDNYVLFILLFALPIPIIVAFALERYIFCNMTNPRLLAIILHTFNIILTICIPFKIVWDFQGHYFLNIYMLSLSMMIFMKLVSFSHAMGDLR